MPSIRSTTYRVATALLLAAAASVPASAQTWGYLVAQRPATEANESYIHAGRLLDRPGRSPRGPSTIIVRSGRIVEVRDGYATPPAGIRLIDLKDRFVLPGLIDAHVHFASGASPLSRFTDNEQMAAYTALVNAQKTLQGGFTTVRNIGDSNGTTLALREAIARGLVTGPRIIDAASAVVPTMGHGDSRIGIAEDFHEPMRSSGVCDGPAECRKAVRLQIGRGADVIKIVTTGLSSAPVGPDQGAQMMADEIKAIIDVAHQHGRKVATHAHGGAGLVWAIQSGVDSVEHGTLMSQSDIALMRKHGTFYVPTLSTVFNYRERLKNPNITPEWRASTEERLKIVGRSVRMAARAGVKIVLGTDAGFVEHGFNARELGLLVENGLTPMQAIMAGTVTAADLLGIPNQVGSIEPGKSADIIAARGDPLSDVKVLESVNFVMREGVVYRTR